MFIRQLDYLSPRVTFYHKGFLSHNSILSGILSIITIIFVLVLAIYYFLEIILREKPNGYYFPTFVEDAGVLSVDTGSLFHFIISTVNVMGQTYNEKIDFTTFNIIGTNIYFNNYFNIVKRNGLEAIDHWLYGYCKKGVHDKELSNLIDYDFFEQSACIQKFYNSTEHQYYEIGHPKFVWPQIAHGTYSQNSSLYSIIVQKCDDRTLYNIFGEGFECKNNSEINSFFNGRYSKVLHFYFLNNYINILNYKEPIFGFFYRIETPLYSNQFSSNDLNFNPSIIKTNDGLILNSEKEDHSYMFDRNDVYSEDNSNNNAYMTYTFFLKNIVEYYERTYKRIQDVISSIGGLNQAITIIAIYLNTFYNNFVVLSDTELLLHSSIKTEKQEQKIRTINTRRNLKVIERLNDNKKKRKDAYKYKDKEINIKNYNNKSDNNNMIIIKNIENSRSNNRLSLANMEESNRDNKLKDNFEKDNSKGIINNDKEKYIIQKQKKFFDYVCYKISCGKKKLYFQVYENFRTKIISEEHLIRNHLNIYNLLRIAEMNKPNRRNSYQLKDLINLI